MLPEGLSVSTNSKTTIVSLIKQDLEQPELVNTPLIGYPRGEEDNILLKMEKNDPSGSFKYRPMIQMVKHAIKMKQNRLMVVSSGNAGIALAMLAKKYHLKSKVYIEPVAKIKAGTCKKFGAEISYDYPRKNFLDQTLELSASLIGNWDISWEKFFKSFLQKHLNEGWYIAQPSIFTNIHALWGYSGISLEVVNQLNNAPDIVMTPVINSDNAIGQWLGYFNLYKKGKIKKIPKFILIERKKRIPHFNYPDAWQIIKQISRVQVIGVEEVEEEDMLKSLQNDKLLNIESISAGPLVVVDKMIRQKQILPKERVVIVISGGAKN